MMIPQKMANTWFFLCSPLKKRLAADHIMVAHVENIPKTSTTEKGHARSPEIRLARYRVGISWLLTSPAFNKIAVFMMTTTRIKATAPTVTPVFASLPFSEDCPSAVK